MNQNPYEAPQTTALTEAPGADPARDVTDMQRGAQLMVYSTCIQLGIVLVECFAMLLELQNQWQRLAWVATIVSTIGGLIKVWGLWLVRRVPSAAQAKLYIDLALVCLILSVASYWTMLGITYLVENYFWFLLGYLICACFGWLSLLLLLWGLRRVGLFYNVPRLRQLATGMCLYYFLSQGISLYQMAVVLFKGQPQEIGVYFAEQRNYFAHPWQFVMGMLSLFLHIMTLRCVLRVTIDQPTDRNAQESLSAESVNLFQWTADISDKI